MKNQTATESVHRIVSDKHVTNVVAEIAAENPLQPACYLRGYHQYTNEDYNENNCDIKDSGGL